MFLLKNKRLKKFHLLALSRKILQFRPETQLVPHTREQTRTRTCMIIRGSTSKVFFQRFVPYVI